MTDITIPPEAVEAAARKIAALKMGLSNDGQYLPDDLWRQALPEATAALRAGIAAWPGMWHIKAVDFEGKVILPLPMEQAVKAKEPRDV